MNKSNKSRGWIKLYRSIQNNPIWDEKPYDKAHAWVDLLLMANHEEKNVGIGGRSILVQEGSFITSLSKLADRWGWPKTTVMRYLKRLENETMIVCKTERKWTDVTIVNWRLYQDMRNDNETKAERNRNVNGAKVDTNKNKEQRTKNIYTPKPNKFNQFSQRDQSEKDYVDLERRKLNGG